MKNTDQNTEPEFSNQIQYGTIENLPPTKMSEKIELLVSVDIILNHKCLGFLPGQAWHI